MSITLFFAKLNLISDDVFKLYDDPSLIKKISSSLYDAVHANQVWKKENIFFDNNNEPHSTIIEYSLHILRTDSTFSNVEGWLYKKSRLHYKVLDNETNKLIPQFTESTEGIRFTLNVNHGFVGYNTSSRFGYREFIEAFVTLVNKGEKSKNCDYRYNMSLCTSEIDLEDIKQGLREIGHIRELRIKMQPPNPSEEILEELQKRSDGLVKAFKEANVTEMELFYSTKGTQGINLGAPFIEDKIADIQGLYSTLPVEESTRKGYVSVAATSTSGRKYSSGESKPIKKTIFSMEGFFESCIDIFNQLH